MDKIQLASLVIGLFFLVALGFGIYIIYNDLNDPFPNMTTCEQAKYILDNADDYKSWALVEQLIIYKELCGGDIYE